MKSFSWWTQSFLTKPGRIWGLLNGYPHLQKHGSKHGSPHPNKLIHKSNNARHSAENAEKRTFPKAFDLGKASFSLAGKGFEPHDLRVMSPTSYQTALPRDIRFNRRNAGHRARTGTILSYHGILSPGRLPIPPLRHIKPMGFLSLLSYYTTPPRVCQGIFKKTCADLPGFPDKFPRFPLKGGRVSRMEDVQAAGNKHEPKRVNVSRRSSRAQAG